MTGSTCLLLATLLPLGQSQDLVRNSDAEVIETALLSFYGETGKLSPEWGRGTFVAARTQYRRKVRSDFKTAIKDMIGHATVRKDAAKLTMLKQARDSAAGSAFAPGEVLPLKRLALDERIVLVDNKRRRFGGHKVVTQAGKRDTARGWASMRVPAYSRDGKFAIVSMAVPWSMHHADVTLLLKRRWVGWSVEHVTHLFYW